MIQFNPKLCYVRTEGMRKERVLILFLSHLAPSHIRTSRLDVTVKVCTFSTWRRDIWARFYLRFFSFFQRITTQISTFDYFKCGYFKFWSLNTLRSETSFRTFGQSYGFGTKIRVSKLRQDYFLSVCFVNSKRSSTKYYINVANVTFC